MSIVQDKLGNDFLRSNGGMDSNFSPGMIMFSHLPPVTSFTRLAAQSVLQELPGSHDMILKKERESPDCGVAGAGGLAGFTGVGDYVHTMGIKQEKMTEHDYRLPLYPGGTEKNMDLLDVPVGNYQNLLVHDLSLGNLPSRLGKDSSGKRGRRSNGDGQEGKPRRRRGEPKSMMPDAEGGSLSPNGKPHICEHCSASFRSSYHLRRHVLIHTGERPFRCSQCNMSFIQKYLLQRHEKIHSGEKPFCCDQCNMRFIQKYHMERHKRTHSGEKPYRCETCQQFFSRTDRLLKHKRTCGEAMKKGLDPGMLDLSSEDMGSGGYGIAQGNAGSLGRKRAKSKNSGEGGDHKRKRALGAAGVLDTALDCFSLHSYGTENHTVSSATQPGPSMHHGHPGRAPKMAFKKANRKVLEKEGLGAAKQDRMNQSGCGVQGEMDGMGLVHGSGAKPGPTSSNYDDAMQFLKKRRYINAANNSAPTGPGVSVGGTSDYEVNVGHLSSQQSVIQGVVSGVMDSEAPLSLLDSSPMGADKQEKSGIPDEVLQSLLDHYSQKPDGSHHDDVHFDIADQHMELHPVSADGADLGRDADSPGPPGDKAVIMHEYSRFLLQALERTSHSAGFPLGPSLSAGGPFTPHQGNPLFSDKHVYTTSPMECAFGQPAASPTLPSTVPKSHFAMLSGSSPQHGFHLSSLEAAGRQQLTPSQELTEQTPHPSSPPSSYQISPSDLASHKDLQSSKNGMTDYPRASPQDLSPHDPSKATYAIENFAQAFGSQFKSAGRGPLSYGSASTGEVDHRIRTPVSEFSGYGSLLVDVNEPVSTSSKTPTSQSYR
ncbi:hypothetical protein DPEC_G00276730 [Dallia pectoralis]|uniref:Uncharacterized protein n=1 Tax=Dallia pectoralis TaxID=75939 RepID=A0ACC2FLS5_DALPE|nr:hypothetical protein DPEC_G00276730 [Dallia pectoralis]